MALANKDCDITNMIKFNVLTKKIPRNLAPSRGLYPSGQFIKVGNLPFGKCPRSVYYDNTLPKKPESNFRLLGMAKMGECIESMVIDTAKQIGVYIDSQYQLVDVENNWSGKIDLLTYGFNFSGFSDKNDMKIDYDIIVPVELKSVYGYYGTMGVIKSNSKRPNKPKPNAVMQNALYVDFLQRNGWNTPYGIIWYISRDEGETKSYKLTIEKKKVGNKELRHIYIDGESYNQFTIEGITQQNLKTTKHIEEKTLPPREYKIQYNKDQLRAMLASGLLSKEDATLVKDDRFCMKGDKECEQCEYNKECYQGIGEEFDDIVLSLYNDEDYNLWRSK
jgi:hypothetical protein